MVKRGRVSAAAPFNSFLVFSISTKIAPLGDGTALGLREFFYFSFCQKYGENEN